MKRMTNLLTRLALLPLLFCFTLIGSSDLFGQAATGGYAGGDLTYQMGNGDTLEVTLNYYIDCGGNAPGSSPFLILRNCSGTPISGKTMAGPTVTEISNTTQTTNCGAGNIAGRRRFQYTTQIDISADLGTACNFYRLTISPNTRNTSRNLQNSTSQNMWLQANIYVQNDATNSSPVFNAQPIPYICRSSQVSFAPDVSDVDGDSLVFSLITARGGTANPSNITYTSGNGTTPISGISVDSETGILSFTSPNDSGNYQVVLQVDEYDPTSGNQISTTYRDFQFHIDSTCVNDGPVPNASFTNTANLSGTSGNDTIFIDTGSAAVWRLTFTDGDGIASYSSNAVNVLGGNATFNTTNSEITWTPGGGDIGVHVVTISALDNATPISGKGAHKVVVVVLESSTPQPLMLTGANTTNVTCPNPVNGTLQVLFTGGIGPWSFRLQGQFTGVDTLQSSPFFSGLPSDNYKITIVDSGSGEDTTEIAFVHPILDLPFGINSFTFLSSISCNDACDGSARVNPNTLGAGGISSYNYAWSNGQSTRTATNLCGGQNIVSITDTNGCQLVDTIVLYEPPALYAQVDSTDSVTCHGGNDGAAYLSAFGGTAASTSTATYVIDNSNGSFEPYPYGQPFNSSSYTQLNLGDDQVSATQNIGFSFEFFGNTFTQFRISSNGFITLGSTNTDNGCCTGDAIPTAGTPNNVIAAFWEDLDPNGGNDGTIEYYRFGSAGDRVLVINFIDVPHFPSGNLVTFQIALYEGSNIIQIYGENLQSDGGNHTQGIENATGSLGFNLAGRSSSNFSATNDYVAFIPASQQFTYTWSSIGNDSSATNLTAGTYTVTITDNDGCGDTVTFDIFEPAQIVIDTTVTPPACQGDTNGQIAVTASGGNGVPFTFAWSTGATGSPLTGLGAGTYTVTATDALGCTDSLTIIIADPAPVTVNFNVTSVDCFGAATGEITATASGGSSGVFNYSWSNGGAGQTITGLTAGTYTVTATDANGCFAIDSATVIQPATPVTVSADSTDETCAGADDGTATATGSGGTGTITYAWSNGGTTATITGLPDGVYTVTATDANGCQATATTTVNAGVSSINVSIIDSTDVSCFGGSDGEAEAGNASGGTGPYTYIWNTGSTNQTVTGLTAGTYTITASDANGCEGTDEVTIGQPATGVSVSIAIDSNASCNGGSDGGMTASGSGGTGAITYAWSTGATSASISGLTAGTYTVTATDANGCTDTASATIAQPTAVDVSIATTQPSCSGGTGSATATGSGGTGGFTYAWSNGGATATITGLAAGTYTVTATDANGCMDTASTTINNATPVTVSLVADSVDCNGASDGSATATASGGNGTFTYAWSTGGAGATITGLSAGTYTVTATDGNGCTATDSIEVDEPTAVSVVVTGTDVSCFGDNDGTATATPSGGTPGYSYAWSNGGSTQTINGLIAGTYTVTVTDNNGCTDTGSVTLAQPSILFAFTSVIDQPTCNNSADGAIQAFGFQGTPGYTYAWSNGGTSQSISGLTAGTYTVTVTDANGCTDTEDETLVAPNAIVLTTDTNSESCSGAADGEAWVTISGGTTPYTISWSTGSSNDSIFGLTAGNYTVTVTDSSGCSDTAVVTIDAGPGVTVSLNGTDPSCNGDTTGSITATATGVGTLTYAWSNGGTAATITGLAAGNYTVTVTDANGCTNTATTTLTDPAALVATGSPLLYETCAQNDGEATVNVTGAQGATTFAWSNGGSTQTITGLDTGIYIVTVTDANGCSDTSSVTIIDTCTCTLTANVIEVDGIDCFGELADTIRCIPAGGTSPYSFAWVTGGTTDTETGLVAGTYTVTVTDNNGCTAVDSITLVEPADITVGAFTNVSLISCDDACDGAATANAAGGTGTLTYAWSSGSNTAAASNLCGGGHYVTITDANGCTDTAILSLVEPPSIWAVVDSTDSASCGGSDGAAFLSAYGGFASTANTATYIVDTLEGEFEPYAYGQPENANSYQNITLADDALSDSIEIFNGGSFEFFGNSRTHFVICSQGFITFSTAQTSTGQVNGLYSVPAAIPSTAANSPTEFIAGYWTDQDPSVGIAEIETYEIGTAPNRVRVINYVNLDHFFNGTVGSGDTSTFQIVLYENSNIIQIHSEQLRSDGDGHVQGIENAAGTVAYGLASRNNTDFEADDDYIAFIPAEQNFTYTWSSIGTGDSDTTLPAGSYTVTVSDGSCTDVVTFDIFEEPSTVVATIAVDSGISCTGNPNTGQLTASATGGAGGYTFAWSTGSTNATISGLGVGTYTVTVSDANGCQDTVQATLSATSNSVPSPTILNNDTTVCDSITLTLNGATNGSTTYSDTSSLQCSSTNGGVVSITFSNVPPTATGNGTLTVTGFGDLAFGVQFIGITDENTNGVGQFNGAGTACVSSSQSYTLSQANINSWAADNTVTFTFDASPLVGFFTTCSGNTFCVSAVLSFPKSAETPYWFEDPLTLDTASAFASGTSTTVTTTTTTTYYLSNFNGVCYSQPDTLNVTIGSPFNKAITVNTPIACAGDSATVTASATGGSGTYTFAWPNGATTATTNLPAGTWCVTIDDGTCSDTACVILTDPAPLVATGALVAVESCVQNDGAATVNTTGGAGTLSYNWSNGGTTQTISGLNTGTYQVTVTDVNGCSDTSAVFVPDTCCGIVPSIAINTPINCVGDSATVTASATGGSGTYTFAWPNGATSASTTLPAGTWCVTIDDGSCQDTACVILTDPAPIVATASTLQNESCVQDDGSVTVNVTGNQGGLTFAWSSGGSTQTLTGLDSGTYTVTVTDAAGCSDTSVAIVIDTCACRVVATIAVDSGISCTGNPNSGQLTASGAGGSNPYSFVWNTGATTATIGSLPAGTYTVIVTDNNGCADTTQATLAGTSSSIASPTIFTNDTTVCDGSTLTLLGSGSSSSSYADTLSQICATSTGGSVVATFSNVPQTATGDATLSVTYYGDMNAATEFIEVYGEGFTILDTLESVWATNCQSGNPNTVNITIPQATILSWASNNTVAFLFDASSPVQTLCAGGIAFCVTPTLTFPTAQDSAYWFADPLTLDTNLAIGQGGSVSVTPAASTSYYYSNFNGVCWSEPDTVDVTVVPPINPSITVNTPIACDGDSATVTASATGGSGTYTFAWPNGSTSATTVLPAGTWCVTIDDGNCSDTACVILTNPAPLVATGVLVAPEGCATNDGSASVNVTGVSGSPTFSWNNGGTTQTISSLTSGTYIVTVTDGNGCSDTASVFVPDTCCAVNAAITVNAAIQCFGDTASITASGGVTGETYIWSTGATTATIQVVDTGQYCVTISDGNCSDSVCINITGPDTVLATNVQIDSALSCNGATNGGQASVAPTGGTTPYNVSWSTGATTNTITGLTAGTYTVTVTDANLCEAVGQVVLTPATTVPTPTVISADTSICPGTGLSLSGTSGSSGTFSQTVSGCNSSIGSLIIPFSNVPGSPLSNGSLDVTFFGDVNGNLEFISIYDESLAFVGNLSGGAAACDTLNQTFTVSQANLSAWANDNTVVFDYAGSINTDTACGNGELYCVEATLSFTSGSDSLYWFDNPSNLDTANAIAIGNILNVNPTVTTTYYLARFDGVCWSGLDSVVVTMLPALTASTTVNTNIACPGDSANVTASGTGGSGTYTFIWPTGDTTATVNLPAGTWCVTVNDVGGNCSDTACVTLTNPAGVTANATGTDPLCPGDSNGTASASATGGATPYGFVWNTGATTQNINNLTAGTYTVTVTDANNCFDIATVTLSNPAGMSASFSAITESSCTSCTGGATVTITGGANPYTFSWPNGQTAGTATLLCSGINAVTVTDNNNCVDSFNVVIPSDSADTVLAFGTDPICADSCDGVVFTSNTCTGGCTFVWTDSATSTVVGTTDTVTGLCAGTYIVELTNGNNCTSYDTITLNNPPAVVASIVTQTNVTCLGGNDGSATASGSGGAGGFTFSWSDGQNTQTANNLTAGTYIVTVTDQDGCSDTAQVTITQPATGLSVVATVDSNVTCNGGNDGAAHALASGGTGTITYTWNGVLNGDSISGLTAGTYTVVVSDAGACTASDTITITQPTPVVGVVDSSSNPSCAGLADGSISVSASGGSGNFTFAWPSGGAGQTETGLTAGTYCVTITDDNGCVDIVCATLVDPNPVTVTFTGISTSSCTVCDGTATAVPSGGNGTPFTFIWANGQTTATNDSLCAGINNVTVTDSLGCFVVDAALINADSADTVMADSIPATCGSCDGVAFAVYNCSNGPCSVEWTALGNATVLGTTDTLDSLCVGTYVVQLTNNLGCVSVDQVEVVSPPVISPNATVTPISCFGAADGSITLNPTGGSGSFNYTWSNSAGNVSSVSNLDTGTYTVTIADNAGCDTVISFNLTQPTEIVVNAAITDASCFGTCDGTITLTPSGGAGSYGYNWSPIPGNGQGVQAATSLCAGEYIVTVSDANGCQTIDTFDITEPTQIVQNPVIVNDAQCGVCDGNIGQTITGGAGGYTYAWSNGDTAASVDSLCFGFYTVTVTDVSGCTASFGHPVSETNGPEITLSGNNTSAQGECDGDATVTVVTSLGNVTFQWSNGDTSATADSLCAGLYIVTATDSNGCSTVDTITIFEPQALNLAFNVSEITCAGGPCDGEIEALVTGGVTPYTYAWSNGETTALITGLCVGTYTVTLTDSNGVVVIDSVTLDNPSNFDVVPTVTNVSCPGSCDGEISLAITGTGVPIILWSTGDTATSIDSLCPGNYSVTITDTSGCADSLDFTITSPPDIDAIIVSQIEPDCQVTNGSITVAGTGGSGGPYVYLWLDAAFDPFIPIEDSSTISNLGAGIYNVVVTDANGCSDTIGVILNNNNAPDINLDSIVNVSCFGECDGAIYVTLSGGTSPFNYLWSSGNTAEDDTALCAGLDTLAVADSNLCLAFGVYEVTEPAELLIASFDVNNVLCGADCDGSVAPVIEGGSAPYSYSWNNGATDSALTDLCAGAYSVTVTDANGCTVAGTVVVGGPTPMVIAVDSTNDATCTYTGDGNVFITLSGGSPGYSYAWGAEDGTVFSSQDLTNVIAGTYILTVTDANGCTINDTFTIGADFFVSVDILGADFEVCPESQGIPVTGSDSLATAVRWLSASGVVLSNGNSALVNVFEDSTIFIFEGTNGVCVARDTIMISETDGPGIDAGPDRFIEPGDEVTIGGDPTANAGVDILWTPNEDISSTSQFNPTVYPLVSTTYYVSGTDDNDCFGIDSVRVTVEKIVDPVNGFSPNGDGVNDLFFIERIQNYPNAVVQIFNRWGNLIYTSNPGYTNPWDGKYNGNELPIGTYYYVIDLKDDAAKELITGPVSILK